MSEDQKTYSIALRIRRVSYEDAYVAVPVTDKILTKNEDGAFHVDAKAFIAEAIRISQDPRVEWKIESQRTEPHEAQRPLPQDRKSFDAFYSDSDSDTA